MTDGIAPVDVKKEATLRPAKRIPPPEYRQALVTAEQKCQDDYDKTVLSLSGGALGVSFIFVKDIVGTGSIHSPSLLLSAWILWASSSLAVLASFFMSHLALRTAIRQCDDGTIYDQPPGGRYAVLTKWLNAFGGIAFVAGVCFMAIFVSSNLSGRDTSNDKQETTKPAAAAQATATAAAANSGSR